MNSNGEFNYDEIESSSQYDSSYEIGKTTENYRSTQRSSSTKPSTDPPAARFSSGSSGSFSRGSLFGPSFSKPSEGKSYFFKPSSGGSRDPWPPSKEGSGSDSDSSDSDSSDSDSSGDDDITSQRTIEITPYYFTTDEATTEVDLNYGEDLDLFFVDSTTLEPETTSTTLRPLTTTFTETSTFKDLESLGSGEGSGDGSGDDLIIRKDSKYSNSKIKKQKPRLANSDDEDYFN
ncbi:CLUMA_CG009975, isoform A [Clunio marinus]|uniref:CLUMA_CG009975, isoform A n=1 Tax=Clunio marinus TaxID=568069 RepID=A0A1J1IBW7_9DIPT|nr:CLUMA_CG009975, isoform A [Clunio marinus]